MASFDVVPAQEAGQSAPAGAHGQVVDEAVRIDGPAGGDLARGQCRHLPVEDGDGFEAVVDDVPDARVAEAVVCVAVTRRNVLHRQGHLVHGVLVERYGTVALGHGRPPWAHGGRRRRAGGRAGPPY